MDGNLVTGLEQTPDDRTEVLRSFVHRYTGTHKPDWAILFRRPDGTEYKPQFKDDADWLAHTRFYVTAKGRLDRRYHECVSSPTWPQGE